MDDRTRANAVVEAARVRVLDAESWAEYSEELLKKLEDSATLMPEKDISALQRLELTLEAQNTIDSESKRLAAVVRRDIEMHTHASLVEATDKLQEGPDAVEGESKLDALLRIAGDTTTLLLSRIADTGVSLHWLLQGRLAFRPPHSRLRAAVWAACLRDKASERAFQGTLPLPSVVAKVEEAFAIWCPEEKSRALLPLVEQSSTMTQAWEVAHNRPCPMPTVQVIALGVHVLRDGVSSPPQLYGTVHQLVALIREMLAEDSHWGGVHSLLEQHAPRLVAKLAEMADAFAVEPRVAGEAASLTALRALLAPAWAGAFANLLSVDGAALLVEQLVLAPPTQRTTAFSRSSLAFLRAHEPTLIEASPMGLQAMQTRLRLAGRHLDVKALTDAVPPEILSELRTARRTASQRTKAQQSLVPFVPSSLPGRPATGSVAGSVAGSVKESVAGSAAAGAREDAKAGESQNALAVGSAASASRPGSGAQVVQSEPAGGARPPPPEAPPPGTFS